MLFIAGISWILGEIAISEPVVESYLLMAIVRVVAIFKIHGTR